MDVVLKFEKKADSVNDISPLQDQLVDRFENSNNQLKKRYDENASLSLRKIDVNKTVKGVRIRKSTKFYYIWKNYLFILVSKKYIAHRKSNTY